MHFVGYLYIMDLFKARKMENIKTMKFILGNQVNVIIPIKQNTLAKFEVQDSWNAEKCKSDTQQTEDGFGAKIFNISTTLNLI